MMDYIHETVTLLVMVSPGALQSINCVIRISICIETEGKQKKIGSSIQI